VSTQAVAAVAPAIELPRGREFRPTAAEGWVHLGLGLMAAGMWVVVALFFWWAGGDVAMAFFGVPIALFVVQLIFHGVSGWRLRDTPLVVDPDGRLRYGDRELCPAGSVVAVRVVPDPLSEGDGHKVALEADTGAAVPLPPPYFDAFVTQAHARRFADRLAAALGVPVVGAD
jgi:hypothetical protein